MNDLQKLPYSDGKVGLSGWLAKPATTPRAAIVVFPTIMNINPRVAEKACALANAGYLALVADYYGVETSSPAEAQPHAKALRSDNALYRRRLLAAIDTIRDLLEATGLPVAAIGFCLGGQAALEVARTGTDIAAVVSFHGMLGSAQPVGKGDTIHPRILVCHGDRDPMVPRQHVGAFMAEMDAANARWHMHIYSGALHGFTDPANDERPLDTVAYDASADRQSWAAMMSFFDEVFEG